MEQTTYQEQEIVATAGQRFENTHFIKCALKAFRAEFYNCTFTDCEFIEAVYTVLYECNFETVTVLKLAEKAYYNCKVDIPVSSVAQAQTNGVEFQSPQETKNINGYIISGRNNKLKTVAYDHARKMREDAKEKAEQRKVATPTSSVNSLTSDKLGEVAITYGKYSEAIEHFNKYLEEQPDAARIVKRLAEAYTYAKRYDLARQSYERYLTLKSAETEIYLELAWSSYGLRETEKALEYMTQAVIRDVNNYDLHFRKGQLYFNLKKYADAAHEFEKGLKINPYSAYGNSFIAAAYYEAGDYDTAMVYTKKALELEPDDKLYQKNYESLLNELGKQPTN
jgi:tetratricopeptide (TPR) repeat protein